MRPALDSNTLDRLISLGRERGHLTTEDLRASLPVESMSAEEIALVVIHLEETGVPVELEESLLTPRPQPVAMPRQSAEIIPFPGPRTDRKTSKAKTLQPAKLPLAELPQTEVQEAPIPHWIIAAAGALTFAVFALIIVASAS